MPVCIYCEKETLDKDMTLEHVIPQALGGKYAPAWLKTHVCKRCNNNLGLFVDASFVKSNLISSALQLATMACYNPKHPISIPLACLGETSAILPGMQKNEVCEFFLGPKGENVYWVRPKDERLYWYTGGNPRTTKDTPTRAYFFFSDRTNEDERASLLCFRDAFKNKQKRVRKVCGTEVEGIELKQFGFSKPDKLDQKRIAKLTQPFSDEWSFKIRQSMNMDFDVRFMAKLARGVAFCLFGNKALTGDYANEISKGIAYQPGSPPPEMLGSGILNQLNLDIKYVRLIGHPTGVTLALIQASEGIVLNLNIAGRFNSTILCAEDAILTPEDRLKISEGVIFVMFRPLQKTIELSLPTYIAHKINAHTNLELASIEKAISQNPYSHSTANDEFNAAAYLKDQGLSL